MESAQLQVYKYKVLANTTEEEEMYDVAAARSRPKPSGTLASIMNLAKGALGAGIMAIHVGYREGGIVPALIFNMLGALYMRHCLGILVSSAQIIYKRTHITFLTYPELGQAVFECSTIPRVQKMGRCFRYWIDAIIIIYLFGGCACYQLIVAKSIKQLVENTLRITIAPQIPGYPGLRTYLAYLIIPTLLMVQLRHLQWIAKFSFVGNIVVGICVISTVAYAFMLNPKFQDLKKYGDLTGFLTFTGMIAMALSCSTTVVPVENNMRNPKRFQFALSCAMCFIYLMTVCSGFFGYVAFLQGSEAPITVNFPMTVYAKIIKILIVIMILITFMLNFWIPFELCFNHLKRRHNPNRHLMWEHIYRTLFALLICLIAIAFPNINKIMAFLGTFCVSNMAFIWPNLIQFLVIRERPGFGAYNWRMWKNIILGIIGLMIFIIGTYITTLDSIKSAGK